MLYEENCKIRSVRTEDGFGRHHKVSSLYDDIIVVIIIQRRH